MEDITSSKRLLREKSLIHSALVIACRDEAVMGSHVPDKGEQMVRYYGYCSNVSRWKRKKETEDNLIPSIIEPETSSNDYR